MGWFARSYSQITHGSSLDSAPLHPLFPPQRSRMPVSPRGTARTNAFVWPFALEPSPTPPVPTHFAPFIWPFPFQLGDTQPCRRAPGVPLLYLGPRLEPP